jgi:site-specific recombinase XerD
LADQTTTGERSKNTERGYKNAVEDFRDNCEVEFLDEITAEVLKRYQLFMFENIKKRVHGTKHNTVAKRFRFLNTFFNKWGIKMVRDRVPKRGDLGLLNYGDVPREQKKPNTDKYSTEEIKAMLNVADVDETHLIHFFFRTGVRDEEAAYMEWKPHRLETKAGDGEGEAGSLETEGQRESKHPCRGRSVIEAAGRTAYSARPEKPSPLPQHFRPSRYASDPATA